MRRRRARHRRARGPRTRRRPPRTRRTRRRPSSRCSLVFAQRLPAGRCSTGTARRRGRARVSPPGRRAGSVTPAPTATTTPTPSWPGMNGGVGFTGQSPWAAWMSVWHSPDVSDPDEQLARSDRRQWDLPDLQRTAELGDDGGLHDATSLVFTGACGVRSSGPGCGSAGVSRARRPARCSMRRISRSAAVRPAPQDRPRTSGPACSSPVPLTRFWGPCRCTTARSAAPCGPGRRWGHTSADSRRRSR